MRWSELFHPARILFVLALFFLFGVALASWFVIAPSVPLIGAMSALGLIALFWKSKPTVALFAVFLLAASCGILRFQQVRDADRILFRIAVQDDSYVRLIGYVADEPEMKKGAQQFVLAVTGERVLVSAPQYPAFHYGQYISVEGMLTVPMQTPGSDFDYKAYLAKDGIYTEMKSRSIAPAVVAVPFGERVAFTVRGALMAVRARFVAALEHSLAEPHAAFMSGLLIGARSTLPDAIQSDFARTGTSHIIAVSGYNITIIAAAIMAALLIFLSRSVAFWATVAGLLAFMVLTGGQASVVRATFMGIAVLIARQTGRLSSPLLILILVATSMVALNPFLLKSDIGFQLSFMATVGLLLVAPIIEERFPRVVRIPLFGETALLTISAQLCTMPILLYYFKSLSVLALPANLLILPMVPTAMLFGFLAGAAGMIVPALGQMMGYFASIISLLMLNIIQAISRISWSAISMDISWYWVIVWYAGLAALLLFLEKFPGSWYDTSQKNNAIHG